MRDVVSWRASKIKNLSHLVAAGFDADPDRLMLMSLDCDNVFAPQFLRQTMTELRGSRQKGSPGLSCAASSGELATT